VRTASILMMEAVRTSETSVDDHSTRQYNPEDSSEHECYIHYTQTFLGKQSKILSLINVVRHLFVRSRLNAPF
jgi:hypothetical protein